MITHEHAELTVDVRMSPGVHLAKDAWFQFIGELEVQEQVGRHAALPRAYGHILAFSWFPLSR